MEEDDAFNELNYDFDDELDNFNYKNDNIEIYKENFLQLSKNNFNQNYQKQWSSELGDQNNPLDWHMKMNVDGTAAKKRKIEQLNNSIAVTTLKIIEARKKNQKFGISVNSDFNTKNLETINCVQENQENEKLLKFPPINGSDWFGVCSGDALQRGYLCTRNQTANFGSLKSKKNLNKEIAAKNFYHLLEEARSELNYDYNTFNTQINIYDDTITKKNCTKNENQFLWIDKYAPKNYFEFVTDDEYNRLTLLWLKLWDEYVFHKKFNFLLFNEKETKFFEMDNKRNNLPKYKIMIIQGSSGIGKSVLAYITAKQAGYRPVFISIMEMQSDTNFYAKLKNSTEINSIESHFNNDITEKSKAACFIIDEIDHASPDIIKLLLSRTTVSKKNVLRPIICICNNLYALNMKELRNNAFILKISGCNKQRLLKRLQFVLTSEGVKLTDLVLQTIVQICRNDIRLSINTLQFFYCSEKINQINSNKKIEKLLILKNNSKNSENSIFETMDAILTFNSHFDKNGVIMNITERCNRIQQIINHRDNLDRFYEILFHNFLDVIKLTNTQTRQAIEYFIYSDLNFCTVYSTQNFNLLRYQCYVAIAIHLCIAVHISKRLLYNLTFLSIFDKRRNSQQIIYSIRNHAMHKALFFNNNEYAQVILPLLLYIIQPQISEVNFQLFSQEDKTKIKKIVSIMRLFKLTYVLKYEELEGKYCLDPAIDTLVTYSNEKLTKNSLSSNLKKYLAHQIEIASIRDNNTLDLNNEKNFSLNKEITEEKKDLSFNFDKALTIPKKDLPEFTFRYNQGSSQAIRRNIRIDSLFFN